MSEPEQCIICLDPLPRSSPSMGGDGQAPFDTAITDGSDAADGDSSYLNILAALDGCDHIIHDACIRSWAQKTNTCPICRKAFHAVRVYNGVDGTAISTYQVKDKKQVAEFDVQQWLGENPEEEDGDAEFHPCPICSSAEREDVLLLCDSCDAAYHTYCIGLDHIPDGEWHCMECVDQFHLTNGEDAIVTDDAGGELPQARAANARRPTNRAHRNFHARTRARLRRARRQARNAEWQGAWGQFSGRFFEMSDLDLDNHDDEDEDMERYRRFQQIDRRELQRWQQRISIAQRLGAHETFANNIPPQISERLQPGSPPVETRDERRAWGAFERVRDEQESSPTRRKRKTRSVSGSPVEPTNQEPERKLKRPRTRRLAHAEGAASATTTNNNTSAATTTTNLPSTAGSSAGRAPNGSSASSSSLSRPGPINNTSDNEPTLVVSSLLKELEPNGQSEDEASGVIGGWRHGPEASSPALSPSPSAYSSPRALSLTPPPLPSANGRPTSPTLSLSTHIEPVYPPANYSPTRHGSGSEHSDSESRAVRAEGRPLELRQPRPRRAHQIPPPPRQEEGSSRWTMTQEEKKSINEIVKNALRPHWRAQRLTTEQYATINRDISRKLYDEVKDASSLDDKTRRTWEKRATQEVAQAVSELQA